MSQFQIFVEGKGDKKFIEDYVLHLGLESNHSFLDVKDIEGKDQLKNMIPIFKTNYPDTVNVLILDADNDCKKRKEEVQQVLAALEFPVPFFIIPNDLENGYLETLLENCINPENKELFECWKNYISCLESKNKNYTVPNDKAKIYAYLESLLGKNEGEKIQIGNRDYLNKKHWNLDSNYLEPLKTFLTNLS